MRIIRATRQREWSQRGAVAIVFGLSLAVLIGFAGLAIDMGRLFVAKGELQNAMDACALNAARFTSATDNANTFYERAIAAGRFAAGRHRAVLQDEAVDPNQVSVTFGKALDDSIFTPTPSGKGWNYVRCTYTQSGIVNSLMSVMGIETSTVAASATASMIASVTNCFFPLGACCEDGGNCTGPDFGFVKGQWYTGALEPNSDKFKPGHFKWVQPPGTSGAKPISELLEGEGACVSVSVGDNVEAKKGNTGSLAKSWNTRFGIYEPSFGMNAGQNPLWPVPDRSGFAYTDVTFPGAQPRNAYTDFSGPGGKQANHIPFQGDSGDLGLGFDNKGQWDNNAYIANAMQLTNGDPTRRAVTMPIISCSAEGKTAQVKRLACMFLLAPIGSVDKTEVEFIGYADEAGSPCASFAGLPAGPGASGPKVPALVQ